MKDLIGSPKQVKWSMDIRRRFILRFHEDILHITNKEYAKKIFNLILNNVVESRYWIDHEKLPMSKMDIFKHCEYGIPIYINGNFHSKKNLSPEEI